MAHARIFFGAVLLAVIFSLSADQTTIKQPAVDIGGYAKGAGRLGIEQDELLFQLVLVGDAQLFKATV